MKLLRLVCLLCFALGYILDLCSSCKYDIVDTLALHHGQIFLNIYIEMITDSQAVTQKQISWKNKWKLMKQTHEISIKHASTYVEIHVLPEHSN